MNKKLNQLTTPHLLSGTSIEKREEVLRYFLNSFETYEKLFDLLASDEAFFEQPEPLRHPLIFYFGHTATFYVNKLVLAHLITKRINPEFESLFAIGVDEMSWDDLGTSKKTWPSVSEVRNYRQEVKAIVINLINNLDFKIPITWNSPEWAILMCIEHERIHLETSSVLIRQLSINYIKPNIDWDACPERDNLAPPNKMQRVTSGLVSLTNSIPSKFYGWDNEYGVHSGNVNTFQASQFLVSNAEFLEFVNADGYNIDKYWSDEGLKWRNYKKAQHPIFWIVRENKFFYRALQEIFPLPLSWPVDVNFHEAKAFCNWKTQTLGLNFRLPTEDEWNRLRDISILGNANINFSGFASSCPIDKFKQGEFYDVVGNVWQWTETPIYPFDGFNVHPLYDDFTTPTFDGKHHLIKGGSWISTGNETTQYSRYAFRRHFFQHAGFRYIQSNETIHISDINYESDTQVSQYSEFHFGDSYFQVPNFAKKSAEICIDQIGNKKNARALDLGCAVGRTSFELARFFDHVDGIDFSARFIKVAMELQEREEIRYLLKEEGDLNSFKIRSLKTMGLSDFKNKVSFYQGDACNLKANFTNYDLIFMGNLIDRLYDPKKLLQEIHERLNIGGILIIASPYTWLEEYTKKENWLGGFKEANGETLTTEESIARILVAGGHFKKLVNSFEIEFVIRETQRKFQHSLSQFNVFERIK